jgi:hypothetical protein
MTVLLEENAAGESSSAPPRKKLCLSLSGRSKQIRVPHNKAAHVKKHNSNNAAGNDFKDKYPKLSISSVKANSSSDVGSSEKASTSLKNSEKDSLKSGNNIILNLLELV